MQFERLGRIGSFVVIAGFAIGATAWTLEMSRRSVAFAFWINWALMGLAFVTWLVAPARFGRSYYRVHAFERSGRVYERLGVRHFQRFLRRVGFMNPWLRYRPGLSAGATLVAATEGSETAHLLIFIMLALVSGIFVRRGWWDTAGWLFLFNIVLNAYPVLSLRSVRARADRLFASPSENGESIRRRPAGVAGTTEAAQQGAAPTSGAWSRLLRAIATPFAAERASVRDEQRRRSSKDVQPAIDVDARASHKSSDLRSRALATAPDLVTRSVVGVTPLSALHGHRRDDFKSARRRLGV